MRPCELFVLHNIACFHFKFLSTYCSMRQAKALFEMCTTACCTVNRYMFFVILLSLYSVHYTLHNCRTISIVRKTVLRPAVQSYKALLLPPFFLCLLQVYAIAPPPFLIRPGRRRRQVQGILFHLPAKKASIHSPKSVRARNVCVQINQN